MKRTYGFNDFFDCIDGCWGLTSRLEYLSGNTQETLEGIESLAQLKEIGKRTRERANSS